MITGSHAMAQNTNRHSPRGDTLEIVAIEAMRLNTTVDAVRWGMERFGTEPTQLQSGTKLLTGPAYECWLQHFDRLDQIYS